MIAYPHAKINLTLSVLGKRADGYHELDTVFMPVSLFDVLKADRIPEEELRFTCGDGAPAGDDNLVCRAYRLMKEKYGFKGGLEVDLKKNIPSEAGLGGGSADAAAMLLLCRDLFEIPASREELAELGGTLGADVAVQVFDGPMRGRGTGTLLTPSETSLELPLLIVKPPVACPTPYMYRRLDEIRLAEGTAFSAAAGESASDAMEAALKAQDAAAVCRNLRNDFERAAEAPEIRETRDALKAAGADGVLLCGSGSAVFGIFPDEASRDRAEKTLAVQGRAVYACHSMSGKVKKGGSRT